ncbi:hypothetical protein [Pseudomonas sp. MWU13-2105]|uniref:hypothetical protein n=1 Tax=Pseudomonas sp. MWU13-2105 TaxID=2935074 RepID=UPI00200C7A24|nr:hypothetical protein [Pseudomonas sp. MWU13-2105]
MRRTTIHTPPCSLMAIGGNIVAMGDIHRYTEPQMNRINAAVVYFSRVNTLWPIIVGVALGLLSRTLGANWF